MIRSSFVLGDWTGCQTTLKQELTSRSLGIRIENDFRDGYNLPRPVVFDGQTRAQTRAGQAVEMHS